MHIQMKFKKTLSFLFTVLVFCGLCFSVPVRAEETAEPVSPRVIRVGFFAFDGYHMEDADGRKSGYGYDFLQMLAVAAENGEKGIELFRNSAPGEFAAVLMDINMPVMDGYTATVKLRALGRADAKKIPVIAMTADAYEEDIKKCYAAGMNGHLAKPVNPEELYHILGREIGK